MKFYTSVLPYRGRLLVRGVDEDGTQKKYRINYKPSLFIPTAKESKYKTLDGRNVAKIKFNSIPETTKWINEYKDVANFEYFGNTRHQYPFIADEFPGKIDWDLKQVKLLSIDIECESENGFPSPDEAAEPLICITVKDHTSKKIIVFGMGNFVNDREDVQYINCVTETGLVETFTKFWVEYNPDIITGWKEASEEAKQSSSILIWLTALAFLIGMAAIFIYVPTEQMEGAVQRIMYFHIPAAWLAFFSFFYCFYMQYFIFMEERKGVGYICASIC